MRKTEVVIISGPSGAGKTTIIKKLFSYTNIRNRFIKTISYTTRPRRNGERNGRDYFFIEKDAFLKLKKKNFFIETQKVLTNYYGTPKMFFQRARKENKGVILCIDVKGAEVLRKKLAKDKKYDLITVFISVPEYEDLYKRLCKRAEQEKEIKRRIELAKKELQFSQSYDYLLINCDLDETVKKLKDILLKKGEDR